jgi:5'-nucleotidase
MASILAVNDDGIHTEGLARLAECLAPLGELTVVAPDRERSAASHALTLHRPLRIREISAGRFAVDGTPADCVYLGALEILDRKPDLIVAGINHGSNIGDDVTYSGTIAAAIEATILGVPSFAISQEARGDVPRGSGRGRFDFANAGVVAQAMARRVLDEGLPADILLNVNVPDGPIHGVRCTRQGRRIYDEAVHVGTDPRGGTYYWIGSGAAPHVDQGSDTDYMAVRTGCVSVCPLHLDMTHYRSLEQLRKRCAEIEDEVAEIVQS